MSKITLETFTNRFREVLEFLLGESIKNASILLAVSGGVDSIVMLELFDTFQSEFGYQIAVATFNHKLRKEADEEVRFVESLCKEKNIPFFTSQADVLHYSKEHKLSIEEGARILRYKFLTYVADNYNYKYIATAHNTNDLLETMILRLTKGTGPYGLVGMSPINGRFIKPLLFFTREEIENYAQARKLRFVTDTSNFDVKYNRNFIRHRIIPLLKEINPSVELASLRLAQSIWELDEYVGSIVDEFNNKYSTKIGEYFVFKLHENSYIQTEQVRRNALLVFGKPIDNEKLERFKNVQKSGKTSYKVSFWKELGIEVSRGWCIMGKIIGYPRFSETVLISKDKVQSELNVNGYFLKITNYGIMKGTSERKLIFEIRNWLEGDRLLSGKKVKELFIEKKVPTFVKHLIPLVVSKQEEKVIYIPYLYEAKEYLREMEITIETKGGLHFES
uniref:tRNA(Ile)-lysidine synthase n=1 Tax=Fervidobacterium nodosum TaxID=2424 RepID=A0A7C5Y9J7_9BACT